MDMCQEGCFCQAGYIRDDNGICISDEECLERAEPCTQNEGGFIINSDYRGTQDRAVSGSLCENWRSTSPHVANGAYTEPFLGSLVFNSYGLGDHNYCRFTGLDDPAWCWTVDGSWGYCGCPDTADILTQGIIELRNYQNDAEVEWRVESDCFDQVRIFSNYFDTESGYDEVTIDGQRYSGNIEIDQLVESSFLVSFSSDGSDTKTGFELEWICYRQPRSPLV